MRAIEAGPVRRTMALMGAGAVFIGTGIAWAEHARADLPATPEQRQQLLIDTIRADAL